MKRGKTRELNDKKYRLGLKNENIARPIKRGESGKFEE